MGKSDSQQVNFMLKVTRGSVNFEYT